MQFVKDLFFIALHIMDASLYPFKVMLQETIRNDDHSVTQRCNIVSNGYNIVPALQRCVALKIVVVNRLV